MLKRIVSEVMLTLLFISMLTLAFNIQSVKLEPATITVPDDYATIQAAINNASAGDTIHVRNGTYTENVVVNKSLNLVGDGWSTTIVNASNPSCHVFEVTADNVNITGFKIVNATGSNSAGIYANGSSLNIINNLITGNNDGILIVNSTSNNILANNITSNSAFGIDFVNVNSSLISKGNHISFNNYSGVSLALSNFNVISENQVFNNSYHGISFEYSNNNTVSENKILFNGGTHAGAFWHGINVSRSNYILISNNNITANIYAGIYVDHSINETIKNNRVCSHPHHGIYLNRVNYSSVTENLAFSNIFFGIWLDGCRNNTVSENNAALNNNTGIKLENSRYNGVFDNNVTSNGNGISVVSTSYVNDIYNNNVTSNGVGILIGFDCGHNVIYNNFFNNTQNANEFGGPNKWNITKTEEQNIIGGSWLGGNFWSDYTGVDRYPYDGIGDTQIPYNRNITRSRGDFLPLTNKKLPVHSLTVNVTNNWTGLPITWANVSVTQVNGTYTGWNLTNSSGIAIFNNLDEGYYWVVASKPAFKTQTLPISVNLTCNKTVNISLVPEGIPAYPYPRWWFLYKHLNFILFNASDSYDSDGDIVEYFWDFGDSKHGYGMVVEHRYEAIGVYNVTLTVRDDDGFTNSSWNLIEITFAVSIYPSSASTMVRQSVTFTSTVSGGYPPYTYQWYLNGNPVSGATADTWTFTPTKSGTFYVYLKVKDAEGNTVQSETACITVFVPVGGGGLYYHI